MNNLSLNEGKGGPGGLTSYSGAFEQNVNSL